MADESRSRAEPAASFVRGMRTSIKSNSAAYGYSVTITASFGVLNALAGGPGVAEIFLFLTGAAVAFTGIELTATKAFQITDVSEPADVVFMGTSFNVFSMAAGVGAATLVAWLLAGWSAWLVGALAATLVYLLVVGLEMAVAERVEG
ncbi:MAG: hypothetical protein ACRDOP_16025 [Gaiellaceae bacterium]